MWAGIKVGCNFYLNNVKINSVRRHRIYVQDTYQVLRCLCALFNCCYIDYTFEDEPVNESRILKFIF